MFSYGNFTSLSVAGVELYALPLLFPQHLSRQHGDRKCMVYMDTATKDRLKFTAQIAHDGPSGARFDHEELPARYAGVLLENTADLDIYFNAKQYNPGLPSNISDVTTVAYFLSRETARTLRLITDEALMNEDAVVVALQGTAVKLVVDTICAMRTEDELSRSSVASFFASDFFAKEAVIFDVTARRVEHTKSA